MTTFIRAVILVGLLVGFPFSFATAQTKPDGDRQGGQALNTTVPDYSKVILAWERRQAEREAQRRGVTVDQVLAERERERARQRQREQLIGLALAGVTAIVLLAGAVVLFRSRRRIGASWRRRSLVFRAWSFGGLCWISGTLLFVWLTDPYNYDLLSLPEGDDARHMLAVMIVPPLFCGIVLWGYGKLVQPMTSR